MSTDKTQINNEFSEDDAQGIAFGPTVLESLLLAIIKGNTSESTKDSTRTRLNKAMMALTGHKSSGAPFSGDPIDKALLFMAQERHKDRCNLFLHEYKIRNDKVATAKPKIRTDLNLAKLAAREILEDTNESTIYSNAHKLRDMFSGRYWKKGGKRTNIDFERTYLYRAVEHDYIQETFENQCLKRLCKELALFGVNTKL